MEQAQKLLKNQQPAVLKDPFPQGQNAASVLNVVRGTSSAPPDKNYINMVRSNTFLQTKNNNYESEAQEKGKSTAETSTLSLLKNQLIQCPRYRKVFLKKHFTTIMLGLLPNIS